MIIIVIIIVIIVKGGGSGGPRIIIIMIIITTTTTVPAQIGRGHETQLRHPPKSGRPRLQQQHGAYWSAAIQQKHELSQRSY